jgi:hypothetical protein
MLSIDVLWIGNAKFNEKANESLFSQLPTEAHSIPATTSVRRETFQSLANYTCRKEVVTSPKPTRSSPV